MESTMDAKTDKGSDILKQETEKKNESEDQNQDIVKETENKNVGEAVEEVASVGEHHDPPCPMVVDDSTPFVSQCDSVSIETETKEDVKETENKNPGEAVGEVASVGDHHDPPCPVVVEEGTPLDPHSDSVTIETRTKEDVKEPENSNPGEAVREVDSVGKHHDSPCSMVLGDCTLPYSDSLTIETRTKDDGPLKTDNETNQVDKNTQLENSSCLKSPSSVALDHDKGLANPTMGTMVEQTEVSTQVSSDISKDGVDFAIVSRDTRVANNETAVKPDSKPREDDVKESVEQDAKMLIEVDKASEEPDSNSLRDHINDPFMPDTQTMKENDNMIREAGTVNSAHHGIGLVDEHQQATTDHDKGPDVLGSETVSNYGNEPFKPDMETSTNSTKGPDLPVTNTLTNVDKRPDVLAAGASDDLEKKLTGVPATQTSSDHDKEISTQEAEPKKDVKDEIPDSEVVVDASLDAIVYEDVTVEPTSDVEMKDNSVASQGKDGDSEDVTVKHDNSEPAILCVASSDVKSTDERQGDLNNGIHKIESMPPTSDGTINSKHSFLLDDMSEGNESGSEEDQSAFMKELDNFFRERNLEFKPPKFYGEGLNCLKLWRAVTRLGGYDKVTACKLWRQVGESFRPPKTCTTVSWTFRGFYEKALLEYERHKVNGGELQIPLASNSEPMNIDNQVSGSGRARRDAAARAMQGWHSQRLIGNGEVSDPIIKDKSSVPQQKREKQIGTPGLLKRKRPMSSEHGAKSAHTQASKPLLDLTVVDVGPPADWVKINVQRTKDCFEVYALVPGLLREEVRVQSDPAGRLVISGEPENPDNLWGATPFKKVLSLPARIDPHHTSAVVTLNGQLFVRVPLEQSD